MRDDQRPDNPSDPGDRRDAFDDALDDLFAPDIPDDKTAPDPGLMVPPPRASFTQESVPPQEARSPEFSTPPYSAPPQRSTGPGIRGWTWRKTGCYTCLGFFGVIFACLLILFIIGLITGDTADPAPAGRLGVGVAIVRLACALA